MNEVEKRNKRIMRLMALIPGMTVCAYETCPPWYQCQWFRLQSPLCSTPGEAFRKLFVKPSGDSNE